MEVIGLGMFDSISELSRLLRPNILDIISREGNSLMSEGFSGFIRVSNSNSSKDVKGRISYLKMIKLVSEKNEHERKTCVDE